MKRAKKHRIKHEMPETSTARLKDNEEHDLAYYIHDRVDLMHQVFSVIKPKELKSLAPECVRHISLDDLQELCTEELLGISSKRLCAILDGAEPPSDTESSSSSPELETISLDSISSDEEILSQSSSKGRKHKHKKHGKSKGKHKRRSSIQEEEKNNENDDQSKATRAGLTVLELLELQARARAIRAQLQRDQRQSPEHAEATKPSQSDDEVEIKEEPAEVVEISSDEEKPNVKDLEDKLTNKEAQGQTDKVTKRINDLIITVPQTKQSRRIKLNRPKALALEESSKESDKNKETTNPKEVETPKEKEAKKKKQKKKQRKEKDSDHDEITLQLSDTEKMDLLEDLDRKNYDNVTSEDSESSSDTDSDSSNSSNENVINNDKRKEKHSTSKTESGKAAAIENSPKKSNEIDMVMEENIKNKQLSDLSNTQETPSDVKLSENNKDCSSNNNDTDNSNKLSGDLSKDKKSNEEVLNHVSTKEPEFETKSQEENKIDAQINEDKAIEDCRLGTENTNIENIKDKSVKDIELEEATTNTAHVEDKDTSQIINVEFEQTEIQTENNKVEDIAAVDLKTNKDVSSPKTINIDLNSNASNVEEKSVTNVKLSPNNDDELLDKAVNKKGNDVEEGVINSNKDLSDGEISEHESEVVCISDEEVKKKKEGKRKKKKKEKKSKKEKSDFREGADENFFQENDKSESKKEPEIIVIDDEIYELSDGSSCFEVEGVSVLSEKPTTDEIVALSAKIDDTIDKEVSEEEKDVEMSWKDRYLGSKKVKRVLSTSNILNALRKKNKELKKKLEEKKIKDLEEKEGLVDVEISADLVEGSIKHYNTLEGSTKYVDPIVIEKPQEKTKISKEMEKDAKQLLKMYKKLLKYNDMNRQKDPSKKKKKKAKKKKDKENKDK